MRPSVFFLTLVLFILAVGAAHAQLSPSSIHTVWDIDETIAVNVDDKSAAKRRAYYLSQPERLVTITWGAKTETYFVFPGVRETISSLLKQGIKVSFFSLGVEERNRVLLEKIFEKPLNEVVTTLLSSHHATDRVKKNLQLFNTDISNVVLIDNSPHGVLKSQEANWLPVNEERLNRIAVAMELFEQARRLAAAQSLSLSETLASVKANTRTLLPSCKSLFAH